MNTQPTASLKRGFTLLELMVAMAITTIIVTVLVSITSIALDTWNRSRSELRASRQAKSMLDTMARDFEAMVIRKGTTNEWFSAVKAPPSGGDLKSTNAAKLVFFTGATDRYNGEIGKASVDKGGDVSCVAYSLEYKDPIGTGFETFVLNRLVVDPDKTFADLLGKPDLTSAFSSYDSKLSDPGNFVCENIYQFTVTFQVQVTDTTQTPPKITQERVTLGPATTSLKILGTGFTTTPASTGPLATGRVTSIQISATVISDFGIDQLKKRKFPTSALQADFLAKNSYQYTKQVELPSL